MTAQGEFDSPFFARKADTPSLARLVFDTGFKRIPDFAGDSQSPPRYSPALSRLGDTGHRLNHPPHPVPSVLTNGMKGTGG